MRVAILEDHLVREADLLPPHNIRVSPDLPDYLDLPLLRQSQLRDMLYRLEVPRFLLEVCRHRPSR